MTSKINVTKSTMSPTKLYNHTLFRVTTCERTSYHWQNNSFG